jgi:hypothetical protein
MRKRLSFTRPSARQRIRAHQRQQQAWLEKEIYVSNPSKNKFIRLSKSLSVYAAGMP